MAITPVTSAATSSLPTTEEEILLEPSQEPKMLTVEERHKQLVDSNTRYIFEQMNRSTQRFTQEMIRQSREREKEDNA